MHLRLYRLDSRNCDLRVTRTSLSSPFVGFLRKNLRLQWERKEAASLGSRSRVWLYSEAEWESWGGVKEQEKRDRGGGRGKRCAFACRAAVWLRCTPTTRTFCSSFVSQPAALGFSAESENGFLPPSSPSCRTAPMTTRRISRPLLPVSYSALSFSQPFPPTIVFSSPARRVVSLCFLRYFYSSTRFPLFITLFKLLDWTDLFVS